MIIPSNYRCAYYFEEISKIPHGSYNEQALSDYLVDFAKELNLKYLQDDLGNVVIYKQASNDKTDAETVMLQAHIDMVNEKNQESNHNFGSDPLDIYIEDGWIKAKGTTLGADDGMGVAYMLAILADDTLIHPALECCFTVLEEVGLIGALHLKADFFKAKNFISLDGGGEVSTLISSAGGERVKLTKTYSLVKNLTNLKCLKLSIRGLKGGHSGGCIDKELGNSNKLLARVLHAIDNQVSIYLASIDGGLKDNAIPREADAIFGINPNDYNTVVAIADKQFKAISTLLEFSDKGFNGLISEVVETCTTTFSQSDTQEIINFIYILPNGLVNKSMRIKDLTLTSLNLGVVNCENSKISLNFSLRSAIDECIDEMKENLITFAKLYNYQVSCDARYPGWNFVENNPLREKLLTVYSTMRNQKMVELAAHGGCECGIFSKLLNTNNIINFGPVTEEIHTPNERLNLASFERCYDLLVGVLKTI